MNTTLSQTATQYLERVRFLLDDINADDRFDILAELESHLILLDELELSTLGARDGAIEQRLGAPEEFVAEFRASAGIETPETNRARRRVTEWQRRVVSHPLWATTEAATRSVRPWWRWVRGWLAVGLVARASYDLAVFERFPIPAALGDTVTGIVMTVAVTWASVWAARSKRLFPRWLNRSLDLAGAVMLVTIVISPLSVIESDALDEMQHVDTGWAGAVLIGPNGEISNIYAYDSEGNPVTVLLYDQNGTPITVSGETVDGSWTADRHGWVGYAFDAYGQPIMNQFPLARFTEDGSDGISMRSELPPPRVALPVQGTEPRPLPASEAD